MNSPSIYYIVIPYVITLVLLVVFAGFVWLVFFLAGVEPHALTRVRPWVAMAFLWLSYGFGIRILLGIMSGGMLETTGWDLVFAVVCWPWFALRVLQLI